MKIDPPALLSPAVALVALFVGIQQTANAVKDVGVWHASPKHVTAPAADPYASLDALFSEPLMVFAPQNRRDPFGLAVSTPPTAVRPSIPPPVVVREPAARPLPVLTAIIWDNDPRATIRFTGREFSVHENSLFAEFRVRSITSSQVVLEQSGGGDIVLTLPKGDK